MKTILKVTSLAVLMAGTAALTTVPASAASGGWAARAEGKTGTYDNYNWGYGYRGSSYGAYRGEGSYAQPAYGYGYGYGAYGDSAYDEDY